MIAPAAPASLWLQVRRLLRLTGPVPARVAIAATRQHLAAQRAEFALYHDALADVDTTDCADDAEAYDERTRRYA